MPTASCAHCAPYAPHHLENWVDDLLALLLFPPFEKLIPQSFIRFADKTALTLFVACGVTQKERQFPLEKVNPIAALFIRHGRKRGIDFEALHGPFGYLTFFRMHANGRAEEFDRLPGAAQNSLLADDKWIVKRELAKRGYVVAPGRAFWWFRKRAAEQFAESLGFPLVVKPRRGSLSQHMFIVKNRAELRTALRNVVPYSPVFLVERFVPGATLYRMTVVDNAAVRGGEADNRKKSGKKIFAVKRIPVSVKGDGKRTLAALVRALGLDVAHLDHALLRRQGVTLHMVIPREKTIFLHHKAVLALRSKIVPVPLKEIHPTILAMCRDVAKSFHLPIVGIDILMQDHRLPLAKQHAAILELNTLPNILMHTFKKNGREENKVADAIVDLTLAQAD